MNQGPPVSPPAAGAPQQRALTILLGAALLLALGLLAASAHVPRGADPYDEGLIATGAALALRGQLPAVDFYAPYPPGAFLALALAFRCWGVALIVERWFAAGLAALAAALGFWLIAGSPDSAGHSRWRTYGAAWVASLAVVLLLGTRWVTPVNGGALALALGTGLGLRAALPRGHPVAALLCGLLAGAAALWRLDFGAYALAAGAVVWLLRAGWSRKQPLSGRQRAAGALALCLGAVAVSGPPLAWILAHGGRRAAQSLIWWPLSGTAAARLPWTQHWSTLLVSVLALLLLVEAWPRLRRDPRRADGALWLLLLGLGFLSYALGRTDAVHLLPLQVVSLLLLGLTQGAGGEGAPPRSGSYGMSSAKDERMGTSPALLGSGLTAHASRLTSYASRLSAAAFLTIVVASALGPLSHLRSDARPGRHCAALPGARGAGVSPPSRRARGYQQIVAYLDRAVPPGARLFCGTPRHDLFLRDDNLAYFLSGRDPGTYYWCLDAGVTTTLPVQAEMARELEANRVEVVLIRAAVINRERNAASRSSGVHLLDDYLRRHFRVAASGVDYLILRRWSSSAAGSIE